MEKILISLRTFFLWGGGIMGRVQNYCKTLIGSTTIWANYELIPKPELWSSGWCSTPNQLLICSSFSREDCHPWLICSSLSTSQSFRGDSLAFHHHFKGDQPASTSIWKIPKLVDSGPLGGKKKNELGRGPLTKKSITRFFPVTF